jgi:hypothetical protein
MSDVGRMECGGAETFSIRYFEYVLPLAVPGGSSEFRAAVSDVDLKGHTIIQLISSLVDS